MEKNIEQTNNTNDWLQTTKKDLDNLVIEISKKKKQEKETDLTFFEDKLFHYLKGRREEMKNDIERKRQKLPSAKFNLGSGKLSFKEKVEQIILQNPNEEKLRVEAEKDLEKEATLQYEIEELSADLKMQITEEFEHYDYFKKAGILPEEVEQFEKILKTPSLKLLANVFTKNLEESLSEIEGIEKDDIEEAKKNIENSLKYIWTSAEIEKSDCDEDEQTMLKAVYSKKFKINPSLVSEFEGQAEYLKQSGIPIESLQSIKPKDIAKAEKILDDQEADEEVNKKVILKKYAPAVAAAILLISVLSAQGMAFAQNAQIDFGVGDNVDDNKSSDKDKNFENLKDSKLKGEIKDTKQEFQPTDTATNIGQQEMETEVSKTDESGKEDADLKEVKSDIDKDIDGSEDVEIIDTYTEAEHFISKDLGKYNLKTDFKNYDQDDMTKLLIASKTEGVEMQWNEIKSFLKAEADKGNTEHYRFILSAEELIKTPKDGDIEKIISLSEDLGLKKDEVIKLFSTDKQEEVREILQKDNYNIEDVEENNSTNNKKNSEAGDETGGGQESKAKEPLGLKTDFSLELGKDKVPAQLERVFSMMAADSMKDVLGDANADGVKMFDEEEGAKILNVAANLVRLSEGKDTAGIKSDTLKDILSWDGKSQKLEIKDYQSFNKLVEDLHNHADQLWTDEVLQKGAVAHLDDIKNDTWQKIIRAEGLEKVGDIETGITGHDDIKADKIIDFKNSAMVQEAEKLAEAAKIAEAAKASAATERFVEKSPQDLEIEKNRAESIKKVLEIFDKKGLANIDEVYKIAEVNPDDGLSIDEIGRIKILAEHQDLLKDLARISENKREDVLQLILDEKISKAALLKVSPRTAELITEIKPSEAIENIPLDETALKIDAIMNSGKMVEKDILLFGKVLAGDEAVKNMNILLGGAGVKNVVFDTENSRISAELFNGKNVNFYSDGRENSIEIRTPFLKSKTLFEGIKPFKTDLSKDGLDSAREKLGVEINTAAEMEILEEVEKIKWVKKKKVL